MDRYSHGDVVLILVPETDEDFEIRCEVNSRLLSSVSPVFQKLFGPDFKEGKLLRETYESGTLPEITMVETSPRAMDFILKAIHHRLGQRDTPQSQGISLCKIAVQVDKYDCAQALGLHLSSWLLKSIEGSVSLSEIMSLLPLLQDDADVSTLGQYVALNATPAQFIEWRDNEDTNVVSLSRIDELSSQSNALRATMIDLIYTHIHAAGDRPEHCFHYVRCSECKEWVGLQQELNSFCKWDNDHTCHGYGIEDKAKLCTRQLRKNALSSALSKADLLPICDKTQGLPVTRIYEKIEKLDPRSIYRCAEAGTPHRCPLYESMDALAIKMKECIGQTKILGDERHGTADEKAHVPDVVHQDETTSKRPGSRILSLFKGCLHQKVDQKPSGQYARKKGCKASK